MKPLLVLTDIHGSYLTMLSMIEQHGKDRQLILLGDLIDRGPRSREVVEYAMTNKVPTTMGNHEDLGIAYSAHAALGFKSRCGVFYDQDVWLFNGGNEALDSWRADELPESRLPLKVLDWMAKLPPYLIFDGPDGKLLASHSGYGFKADVDDWMTALWGRYPDNGDFPDDGYLRVFGHTKNRQAQNGKGWVNIDTGCAYKGYGVLTGFLWPERVLVTQGNVD